MRLLNLARNNFHENRAQALCELAQKLVHNNTLTELNLTDTIRDKDTFDVFKKTSVKIIYSPQRSFKDHLIACCFTGCVSLAAGIMYNPLLTQQMVPNGFGAMPMGGIIGGGITGTVFGAQVMNFIFPPHNNPDDNADNA